MIDDDQYNLAIETVVSPSKALKALMAVPDDVWSFDCAEFVQVCNLYATMELYGDESVNKSSPLVLRQHASTPFRGSGVTFARQDKAANFEAIFHGMDNKYTTVEIGADALLRAVPPGSRVCFKNPAAPDTPFRNENAIALGGGKFAAHPMGKDLTPEQIVASLVRHNRALSLGGESCGEDEIFISSAEIFGSIPMTQATVQALGLEAFAKVLIQD